MGTAITESLLRDRRNRFASLPEHVRREAAQGATERLQRQPKTLAVLRQEVVDAACAYRDLDWDVGDIADQIIQCLNDAVDAYRAAMSRKRRGRKVPNRVCRHCQKPYMTRAGRGLCSTCWRLPGVKDKYPILAPFGGAEAGRVWEKL